MEDQLAEKKLEVGKLSKGWSNNPDRKFEHLSGGYGYDERKDSTDTGHKDRPDGTWMWAAPEGAESKVAPLGTGRHWERCH